MRYTVLLCVLALGSCYVQRSNSVQTKPPKTIVRPNNYVDFLEEGEKVIDYGYNYMKSQDPLGTTIYRVFYPEKQLLTEYCEYHDLGLVEKHGQYRSYTDTGKLSEKGSYYNGYKEGVWESWSIDGRKFRGSYINNRKEGEWITTDTLGNRTIENFIEGMLDGEAITYDSMNVVKPEEGLKKGFVLAMPYLAQFESIENLEERQQLSQKQMLTQLYRNLKYPAKAREEGVEGMAIMQFVIDKEGKLTKPRAIKGICEPIEKACLDVLQYLGPWNPGTEDGKAVDVQYTLPIRFKLQ